MKRYILTPDNQEEAVQAALDALSGGGLVLYPTETVYGVGVDALNAGAVSSLLKYKNRPAGKAVSVLVSGQEEAERYVELNEQACNLFRTFLPGPLTVVSKGRGAIDGRLPSELNTLGIRVSSHPLAMELARRYGRPITATSANASGRGRAYSIDTVLAGLSENQQSLITVILDAGILPHRDPSTVIDTTAETQQIVRGGAWLERVLPVKETESEEETVAFAREIMAGQRGLLNERPVVFILEGDLGVGKTRFAKGVAQAVGVSQNVNSPTYTIMKEYDGEVEGRPVRLVHLDCWRLDEVDPGQLGLEAYLKPDTVIVAEWAGSLLPYFEQVAEPVRIIYVHLEEGTSVRRIRLEEVSR